MLSLLLSGRDKCLETWDKTTDGGGCAVFDVCITCGLVWVGMWVRGSGDSKEFVNKAIAVEVA